MRRRFEIAGRGVGPGARCFIIAEAGVNHDGDLKRALDLIDVAAAAGADAVKFQTFSAERLVTRSAPKAAYQVQTTGSDETHYEMLARLELSPAAHRALFERCAARGIIFLSTPFDEVAADFLHELGVAAFKIASGEVTNLPLLRHVARIGKPVVMSSGMATLAEVEAAVTAVESAGAEQLAILHCVSTYPTAAADANLRAMATLSAAFGVPVGYSDHTLGLDVAIAAVALGADVIEKHITLDRALRGPDHRASLEPDELAALVKSVRNVEAALGDGRKEPTRLEAANARVVRKSLVTTRDIASGQTIGDADLTAKRPGTGISPARLEAVVGRTAGVGIPAGTIVRWEMFRAP